MKDISWYKKVYDNLVKTRLIRGLDKEKLGYYTEKHHIIPKCMGGKDENSNYVLFTPKEHILAHVLLAKIYPDNLEIIRSTSAILMKNKGRKDGKDLSIRTISNIREEYSKHLREFNLKQVGREVSKETRNNLSKARTGKPLSPEAKRKTVEKIWSTTIQGPDGTIYNSMKECAEKNNVSYQTIQFRLKKHPDQWKIIDSTRRSKSYKVQGPDGTIYNSLSECAKNVNRHGKTIKRWIEKYPEMGYKYVD